MLLEPDEKGLPDQAAPRDEVDANQPSSPSENVEEQISAPENSTTPAKKSEFDVRVEIKKLMHLSTIQYEQCRIEKAKELGLRPSVLDTLVKQHNDTGDPSTETSEMFPDVPPWDDLVDGALLLYAIVAIIERHIACEQHVAQTAALWIAFSWCIQVMKIAPIACITAPEKRCGKTQLLTLMNRLCLKPMSTSNITAPALFRSIEKWKPTLFIDEADAFLKQNEEMRGVLNAGFEVDGCVIRTVGEDFTPTPFNVFCAKAISGIGHLPDTLKDRSILLELRRKRKDETRERLRHADPAEFDEIKRKLARWADDNMEALRLARPALPDALNDRAQDSWEPLLAIADQVGSDWSNIARDAALKISGCEEDSPSINEELLADIKLIFQSTNTPNISSFDLLFKLCIDEESPWATWNKGKPMTSRQLAKRLGEFSISSKQVRQGAKTLKGYVMADFQDAFDRY